MVYLLTAVVLLSLGLKPGSWQNQKDTPPYFYLHTFLYYLKKTLYNKANRGEIPYFKFGRLVRFKKSDIDAWEIGQRKIVDADKSAKDIIRSFDKNDMMDIDVIMHKAIEETTVKKVYSNHRKVRPTKGLGEEEKDGTF